VSSTTETIGKTVFEWTKGTDYAPSMHRINGRKVTAEAFEARRAALLASMRATRARSFEEGSL
jgi:hypothetical protein